MGSNRKGGNKATALLFEPKHYYSIVQSPVFYEKNHMIENCIISHFTLMKGYLASFETLVIWLRYFETFHLFNFYFYIILLYYSGHTNVRHATQVSQFPRPKSFVLISTICLHYILITQSTKRFSESLILLPRGLFI